MVFSSWLFIVYFLPLVLMVYYLIPKHRNLVLLISSLAFYTFGEPIYIVLLIFSSTIDYHLSKRIESSNTPKKYLYLSILLNIGLLSIFKYSDFLISIINSFGVNLPFLRLGLPIGISFYTFQTLSYTIDVYRGNTKASKSYLDYMMYVSMFPQLIAGPIVKYKDIEKSIKNRIHSTDKFYEGIHRFVIGLAKKVIIADQLASLHQQLSNSEVSLVGSWAMLIAFGLHIYYDFSGYSDMAIGLGKMFGFDLLENFNYPYIASSVSEFWQRWHISLGSWFREYLYFPLGGSRGAKSKVIRNLVIVWALTGLWHGASLNFVFWGFYFSIFIVVEKIFKDWFNNIPKLVRHLYLLVVVTISWTFFSIESLEMQFEVLKGLVGLSNIISEDVIYFLTQYLSIIVVAIIGCVPHQLKLYGRVKGWFMIILFIITMTYIVDSSFSPFIYFRF